MLIPHETKLPLVQASHGIVPQLGLDEGLQEFDDWAGHYYEAILADKWGDREYLVQTNESVLEVLLGPRRVPEFWGG